MANRAADTEYDSSEPEDILSVESEEEEVHEYVPSDDEEHEEESDHEVGTVSFNGDTEDDEEINSEQEESASRPSADSVAESDEEDSSEAFQLALMNMYFPNNPPAPPVMPANLRTPSPPTLTNAFAMHSKRVKRRSQDNNSVVTDSSDERKRARNDAGSSPKLRAFEG